MIATDALSVASRRRFLKSAGAAVGGLTLGFDLKLIGADAVAQTVAPAPAVPPPSAYLRIATDGSVTILSPKSEMGQGIYTGIATLIAEELEVDLTSIKVVASPTAVVYGNQGTGGSGSMQRGGYKQYLLVGAAARLMLVAVAAERLGVTAASLTAAKGRVTHGSSGRSLGYGELAEAAAKLAVPAAADIVLKPRGDYRIVGKPGNRVDNMEKISGSGVFGMDVRLPDMLTAVVARCPVYGGTPIGFDETATRKVKGVKAVVQISNGVAVIADGFWAAKRGRDFLKVTWNEGDNAKLSTDAILADYKTLADKPGTVVKSEGTPPVASARTIEALYTQPYLAHATMEPMNCVVHLKADGSCEVWTGSQSQTRDRASVAELLGLKLEQVTLHNMLLGGGFGRRGLFGLFKNPDWIAEGAEIALQSKLNVPIKLVWTREDDMTGSYYRPMWVDKITARLDPKGMPLSWVHTSVGQSLAVGTAFAPRRIVNGIDLLSTEGAGDTPYQLPHFQMSLHSPTNGVRATFWRAVGHNHTAFVMETFIDELAAAAGQDPLAFRQPLLKSQPRTLGVLNLVAEKAGWSLPAAPGIARGIAVHESYGSYVAQVVEIKMSGNAVKLHRVVCAVDCGLAIVPDQVKAQMESSIVFGLSAACYGDITIRNGRTVQDNFDGYRVLRMFDAPRIEVHIVDSPAEPGGAGEPGLPPSIPALVNAIHAATGRRIRSLPLTAQGLNFV